VTIRVLENGPTFKRGFYKVSEELGRQLISQGIAVIVREEATDKQAHDSLNDAKARDQQQGSN
jgi:hypothetical protein